MAPGLSLRLGVCRSTQRKNTMLENHIPVDPNDPYFCASGNRKLSDCQENIIKQAYR